MRFHAQHVSASEAGDYFRLWLGPQEADDEERDTGEVKGPYLIVQRQFEVPGGGECYIETHDEAYVGHFRLRLTELSRTRLSFEIKRKTNTRVEVECSLSPTEFAKVRRVGEIVFGLREPEWRSDDGALERRSPDTAADPPRKPRGSVAPRRNEP
ncbi:MAG: hypothetical protein A3H32_06795 [Betaproteobacteria bacterium RIFCSPLOWO2_02_FULL_63_19]|nr:MAG: hypothetical protein A3H32_06795 [Betaproteobacteria bacterium RIFCSPLOWO2_02_FULL_63_19]